MRRPNKPVVALALSASLHLQFNTGKRQRFGHSNGAHSIPRDGIHRPINIDRSKSFGRKTHTHAHKKQRTGDRRTDGRSPTLPLQRACVRGRPRGRFFRCLNKVRSVLLPQIGINNAPKMGCIIILDARLSPVLLQ